MPTRNTKEISPEGRRKAECETSRTRPPQRPPLPPHNRYDRNGRYILGSNPNDTPYNTYPGPTLDKRKMAEWCAFRDEYKARKGRGKANEKAYKDDQKAHGGTVALPGGYRTVKGKGGGIITPEGKLIGEDNRKNRKYLENNKAVSSSKAPENPLPRLPL